MAYTRATIQESFDRIKADMEARVSDGGAAIPPTSLLGVLASVIAGASFLTQGFIQWVANQIFLSNADEVGLTRWGAVLGMPRNAATYTTGTIAFTGTAGVTVASGTQVQNENGIAFETGAAFIIGTTTSVTCEALTEGTDGNTEESTVSLVSPLSGVNTDATVISGFDDGEDEESLDAWRDRLLSRFQSPPAGGTVVDFERWALTADGVAFAWAFAAADWAGAGTVGIAVSGSDYDQLSAGSITTVQGVIDALRPIGCYATVFSPAPVDVDFDISISPNTTALQEAIESSIRELYETDAAPNSTMFISRLYSAISAAGPSDFSVNEISVGGVVYDPPTNYTVTINQVPRVGTFTWSAV